MRGRRWLGLTYLFNFTLKYGLLSIYADDDDDDVEVPLEDLRNASELVVRALLIRKKYMNMSSQQFPTVTERFLHQLSEATSSTDHNPASSPYQTGLYTCCMSVSQSVTAAPSPGWGPRGQGPGKNRQGPGKSKVRWNARPD